MAVLHHRPPRDLPPSRHRAVSASARHGRRQAGACARRLMPWPGSAARPMELSGRR